MSMDFWAMLFLSGWGGFIICYLVVGRIVSGDAKHSDSPVFAAVLVGSVGVSILTIMISGAMWMWLLPKASGCE